MLSLDPAILQDEIDSAEKLRLKHLKNTADLIRKYAGNYFRDDSHTTPLPENLVFSYVAGILPEIVFDNPQVAVSTTRTITERQTAEAMEEGLNQWIKHVGLRTTLEMGCLDYLFCHTVFKVGLEQVGDFNGRAVNEDFTSEALIPYLLRVAPEEFFIDSQAKSFSTARLMGHRFQRDLDDLKQDQRYDQSIVAKLSAEYDPQRSNGGETAWKPPKGAPDRKRVVLHEVYLPEYRSIGTLAFGSGKAAWVRALQPYYGPADGPYCFFGAYPVPGEAYFLSPIAALAEAFLNLNAHTVAAADEAATQKELLIVNENNDDLNNAIMTAPTGSVVKAKNFDPKMALPVTFGGTSKTRLDYINYTRAQLDRQMGTSDAERGRAASVTATEAAITDSNADARTDYIHLQFREGVKRALRKVGWFLFNSDAVVMQMSWQHPQTGQDTEGYFMGGAQEGQDWEEQYGLELEPYSMRRVDPVLEQQRAQQMVQLALQVAPMIPQTPWINWEAILDALGEANNQPGYAEQILSPQGLAMIQQAGAPMGPGMMAPGMGMAPPGAMMPPGAPAGPPVQATAGGMTSGPGALAGQPPPGGSYPRLVNQVRGMAMAGAA